MVSAGLRPGVEHAATGGGVQELGFRFSESPDRACQRPLRQASRALGGEVQPQVLLLRSVHHLVLYFFPVLG